MVFITVMFKVLLVSICIGAAVSVLVLVPLFLYSIPYILWVGTQNLVGKQKDKNDESFFTTVKNATKLYKAKLSGREPTF